MMKNLLLFLWIGFITLGVNAQLKFDKSNAPENPMSFAYTANQMGYFGQPKTVSKTSYGNTFVYEFFKDGRLKSCTSPFYAKPSEYEYDDSKCLVKNIVHYKDAISISLFEANSDGQVTRYDLTDAELVTTYNYNDKGLMVNEKNTDGLNVAYEYDAEGRISKSKSQFGETHFSYSKERGYLKLTKRTVSKDREYTYHYYYDDYGNNVGNDTPKEELALPQILVKLDDVGNALEIKHSHNDRFIEATTFVYY